MKNLSSRLELAKHFAKLDFKTGAEIGVFSGYFSEVLCQAIPNLKLYCVDAWEVYPGYRNSKFEPNMLEAYNTAKTRLAPFNAQIIKKFSTDAVKGFKDGSLDFVYIDGNHEYKYVKQDIEAWTPKVRKGGIIAGDDYYMTKTGNLGVIQAVHEYVDKYGYELQLIGWDLNNPVEDNRQPQWWFVK